MLLSSPDPAKPWLERYETEGIIEWLRWLGIDLSRARAEEIGLEVLRLVQGAREANASGGAIAPDVADDIAARALHAID
jgi:hypothetical protein